MNSPAEKFPIYGEHHLGVRLVKAQKPVDSSAHRDGTIPPEALRLYLVERRRALLTELRQLDRLLGFTTE